jgi:hypothetical protein
VITLQQYFMGRDASHFRDLTQEVMDNAEITVTRVGTFLEIAANNGCDFGPVASGWRPAGLNAGVPGAAAKSKHITAEACDIRDTPARSLARFALDRIDVLEALGLWIERPQWTPTWVHFQIVPPRSGKRVFIPSSQPPACPPLPGEEFWNTQ